MYVCCVQVRRFFLAHVIMAIPIVFEPLPFPSGSAHVFDSSLSVACVLGVDSTCCHLDSKKRYVVEVQDERISSTCMESIHVILVENKFVEIEQ